MADKVSGIILAKNEGYNLAKCIEHLVDYLNEIIVIDSSDDDTAKRICDDFRCKYFHKEIGKDGIKGFNDLRNYGNVVAKNEWVLHVDVDEIFSDSFLQNINGLVELQKRWACKFPRINLPFYERYPDYQVRLVNKVMTEWIGGVHEKVDIFEKPYEFTVFDEYPIIHLKNENKLEINKRWDEIKNEYNILIVSLFKDSEKFIFKFLDCLEKMIKYTEKYGCIIDILFIEGNSNDKTLSLLNQWLEKFNRKNFVLIKMDINNTIDRWFKLEILRNMGIKLGLRNQDYILMIDSDVIFDENLLVRLIDSIKKNNADVVAPAVYIENFRTFGSGYFYDTLAYIKNEINFEHYFPYHKDIDWNNKVVEVDSVGTCYLIISDAYNINDIQNFSVVKCYEEVKRKIICKYDGDGKSEQVGFFNNVKKAGYKVIVDFNIEMYHINLEKIGLKWH